APPSQAQQPARIVQISRVSSPPHLDQFLDHRHTEGGPRHRSIETGEGGLGVVVTDLRQREPGDGTPVSEETTVYLSYDDENLYAVFVCRDEPAKIRASIARREEIDADDAVASYLDAFHDRGHAYVFMANPRGVQLDRTQRPAQPLQHPGTRSVPRRGRAGVRDGGRRARRARREGRAAGRLDAGRDGQPRLQPGRDGRSAGHAERAVRGVLPGKA